VAATQWQRQLLQLLQLLGKFIESHWEQLSIDFLSELDAEDGSEKCAKANAKAKLKSNHTTLKPMQISSSAASVSTLNTSTFQRHLTDASRRFAAFAVVPIFTFILRDTLDRFIETSRQTWKKSAWLAF